MNRRALLIPFMVLISMLLFSVTACEKKEQIDLVRDDEMGYDMTGQFGADMDAVLDALRADGAELTEVKDSSIPTWVLKDRQYGQETEMRLCFYRFKDEKNAKLIAFDEKAEGDAWPEKESGAAQMVLKQYAGLEETLGEPVTKSPTLQDPDDIMNAPAQRNAEWVDDGKNLHVIFEVGGTADHFSFTVAYRDKELTTRYYDESGVNIPIWYDDSDEG